MPSGVATFPLVPRRRLIGLAFGAMRSARRGRGFDVIGSRAYRPGDDVRAIDWGASARFSAARGTDEFVVRERFTEEAPRVVVVCDRRPEMALFPPGLPWLSKPEAMRVAGSLIADTTLAARGLVGYLDYASLEHPDPAHRSEGPFWRPPTSQHEHWRMKEEHLVYPGFHAPADNLDLALGYLGELRRTLPTGSFVFVLSDFIRPPPPEVWNDALELPWDLVPVIVQDPVWEQSFPAVGGLGVPFADPATGIVRLVRLTRREADARRRVNEERLARLLDLFESLDLQPVLVSSSEPDDVLGAFLGWAALREAAVIVG
jgi:Protein of unknown function DUF58